LERRVIVSKYDWETRGRVVRLFRARRLEPSEKSGHALYRRVNELVGDFVDSEQSAKNLRAYTWN
jgi:hypothetical protein